MRARLSVTRAFSAQHFTPLFPEGHPDREPHPHDWTATLVAEGEPDEHGMVINTAMFGGLLGELVKMLDGKLINDLLPGRATDECLAAWLLERARLWAPHGEKIVRCIIAREGQSAETWA